MLKRTAARGESTQTATRFASQSQAQPRQQLKKQQVNLTNVFLTAKETGREKPPFGRLRNQPRQAQSPHAPFPSVLLGCGGDGRRGDENPGLSGPSPPQGTRRLQPWTPPWLLETLPASGSCHQHAPDTGEVKEPSHRLPRHQRPPGSPGCARVCTKDWLALQCAIGPMGKKSNVLLMEGVHRQATTPRSDLLTRLRRL